MKPTKSTTHTQQFETFKRYSFNIFVKEEHKETNIIEAICKYYSHNLGHL